MLRGGLDMQALDVLPEHHGKPGAARCWRPLWLRELHIGETKGETK